MKEETQQNDWTGILPEEVRELCEKPFPAESMKAVESKSYLTTIKAMYVVERLNDVFGIGGWHLDYVEKMCGESGYWLVHGRIRVPNFNYQTIKTYGGHKTDGKGTEIADGAKSAVTDLLTKCASYMHVGLEVFKGNVKSPRNGAGGKRNAPPPSNTQLPDPPKADLSPSNAKLILGLIKQGKVEEARKLIKVHKRTKDQDAQFKAAFDAASKPKPPVPEEDFQKALSLISEGDADGARNLLKPFTLHPDQVEMLRMTEVSYNDANALLGAAIETPKGK